MKKILNVVFKIWCSFFLCISLWLLCAWLLPFIKVNKTLNVQKPISIYVSSNGVHTDIVVQRKNKIYDWDSIINPNLFTNVDTTFKNIAFGWGDKGFYLDTPTWDDLKVSTVFNATFGLGNTAMHVHYYKPITASVSTKEINISENDYLNLVNYINQSFKLQHKALQLITHPNYGKHDNYFEAKGKYNLFKTCNVWTGNALKSANVSIGLWTPLESGVMRWQ